MSRFLFTARPMGDDEAYLPLSSCGLASSIHVLGSDGACRQPQMIEITVSNTGAQAWTGVVRMELPVDGGDPQYFLPGYLYGTNRGDTPLFMEKKTPRLRKESLFPASPWWMTRSDRLSHPAAFAYAGGRLVGFAAAPYFLRTGDGRAPWQPGVTGEFDQYAGFGCALEPQALYYTLGYENAPYFFLDSKNITPRAPMGDNCITLAPGEAITFTVQLFDCPADDERVLHDALRTVYARYHESPRRASSLQETVRMMAGAIYHDAWREESKSYSGFVFDRFTHYEHKALPSIAWTNGLAAAAPMLMCAHRLGDEAMRAQAISCIDHIVANSMNEASGLPYMGQYDGVWSNHGWWHHGQHTPGHAAYLVGQFTYLLLTAYLFEKEHTGTVHEDWLAFASRIVAKTETTRNGDHEYPYIFSERTGAGLEYDSMSGAWCLAAAALLSRITGDTAYLPGMLAAEAHYHDAFVRHVQCWGGPLDIDKQIDSEGVLPYIRAVRRLYEITGEAFLLDHMRDALHYEFTFKFCYNSPIKVPPLSTVGWSSCGGSITSVTNPHIHPMSSSIIEEMMMYLSLREDAYIRSRLEDTLLWSCQCHNTFDGEFGYGKTGWMSERFCHCEGLLRERYPDGSPSSTWFALMPWACGSILEGLAGEAWDRA